MKGERMGTEIFTSCTSKYKDPIQLKKWNKTYCFMHSGIPTYSMGTSSASSAKLKTYLIFWLNFELWKEIKIITLIFLTNRTDKKFIQGVCGVFFKSQFLFSENYLINGLVTARSVLINQEGCTMIRDFRFFRNLEFKKKRKM